MKIKKVKIKNFRGYGENKFSDDKFFTFDNLSDFNIVILTGLNGHGKTSFYEAIEWCLTGDIKRLEKIVIDTNKNIQRKSCNLIFNSSEKDEKGKQVLRKEAIVVVEFDNGEILTRKSSSNSLIESIDEVELARNGAKYYGDAAINELISDLTDRNIEIDKVYKSISLGQETLANFLRGEKSTERNKELMNLFNLEEFDTLTEKSDAKKFSVLLGTNYDEEIKDINNSKKYINRIFLSSGFTVDKYLNEIREYGTKLKEHYKEQISYELEQDNIESNLGFINYLENKKEELVVQINTIKLNNDKLIKSVYSKKYKAIKQDEINIKKLQDLDLKGMENRLSIIKNKSNKYKGYIKLVEKYKGNLKEKQNNINKLMVKDNFYIIDDLKINSIFLSVKECIKEDIEEKFNKLKSLNKEFVDIYNDLEESIKANDKEIQSLSALNEEYKNSLNEIKNYIIKNPIDRCPVCGNKNIELINNKLNKNSDVKDKILVIINNTITNNDDKLNKKIEMSDKEKERQIKLQEQYLKDILNTIKKYQEISISKIEKKLNRIEVFVDQTNYYIDKLDIYKREIDQKMNIYTELNSLLISKNKKNVQLEEIEEITKNKKNTLFNIIKNRYNIFNKGEIVNLLENTLEDSETERSINDILRKIKKQKESNIDKKLLIKDIEEAVKKYKISDANLEEIKKYDKYSQKEEEYKKKTEILDKYKKDREKIYSTFSKVSKDLLDKKLNEYKGLGNYIYKLISPHPFFKEFDFVERYSGTDITFKDNNNINLGHIFSNAQVNILALSIFLGLGLLDNKINIDQLFIDDPIHSMDDINVLAFIDLLRTMLISEKIKKQLIISTHNRDFSSLLKIKLRNIQYKEIKFKYYGKEGPIIEEYIHE
ncbi:AAA family ATPase [Clostridium butyricum]